MLESKPPGGLAEFRPGEFERRLRWPYASSAGGKSAGSRLGYDPDIGLALDPGLGHGFAQAIRRHERLGCLFRLEVVPRGYVIGVTDCLLDGVSDDPHRPPL
jgi:hypothetical protein